MPHRIEFEGINLSPAQPR